MTSLRAFSRRLDPLLGGALVALGEVSVWTGWNDGGVGVPEGHRLARALLLFLTAGPLVWRRRRPVTVLLVITVAMATQVVLVAAYLPFLGALLPMAVVTYTVSAHAPRWRGVGLVLPLLTELAIFSAVPDERRQGEVFFSVFVVVATWLVGDVVRDRMRRAEADVAAARRGADKHREQAELALAEERSRIARELHDVIAHGVSVMGVQAGAARTLLDVGDLPAARCAVLAVEEAARTSVGELQRLLTVLRAADTATVETAGPQPGMADLDRLVADVRDAGLPVEVAHGALPALPVGIDLAAYRIVQESLTNALRHGSGPTTVAVRLVGGTVEIEVRGGRAGALPRPGGGHGLVGMRERAELYGGTVTAGPTPQGDWRVHARIPVPAVDTSLPAPVTP